MSDEAMDKLLAYWGGQRPGGMANCRCMLEPGEQILSRDFPPAVAFHPARLARMKWGAPPPLVLTALD